MTQYQVSFYQNYWVDMNINDKKKIENWNSFLCPVEYVTSYSGSVGSFQPLKDKKFTLDQLLLNIPSAMVEQANDVLGRKVDDFRVKAPVYQISPLSAKLGKKEGLYYEQRFFAYEIGLDKKGNQKKYRKGVARVRTISSNESIANGQSKPSTFRQQGGKKLYEGMLLESQDDIGTVFKMGYISTPNKAIGGVSLGLDYLIKKVKNYHGLYIGIDLTINSFDNVSPGNIFMYDENESIQITTNEKEWSGSTLSVYGHLTKELYFTKKGNIYLAPSIGYGINTYNFREYQNEPLADKFKDYDPENNPYTFSTRIVPVKLGLGYHINPKVSIELHQGIVFIRDYNTTLKNSEGKPVSYSLRQESPRNEVNTDWGFDKLTRISSPFTMEFMFKVRL
jgi:hypothetical protein